MLALDDSRWGNLTGGYRTKCDPRPLLAKLESGLTQKPPGMSFGTTSTIREMWGMPPMQPCRTS
jgi:hypothetical protein